MCLPVTKVHLSVGNLELLGMPSDTLVSVDIRTDNLLSG